MNKAPHRAPWQPMICLEINMVACPYFPLKTRFQKVTPPDERFPRVRAYVWNSVKKICPTTVFQSNKFCQHGIIIPPIRHAWFIRKASLLAVASLIPKPPSCLDLVMDSQFSKCTCFWVAVSPQRKPRINLFMWSRTPFGIWVVCMA